jgi:hypothetical protein
LISFSVSRCFRPVSRVAVLIIYGSSLINIKVIY